MRGRILVVVAVASAALWMPATARADAVADVTADVRAIAKLHGIEVAQVADRLEVDQLAGQVEADARELAPQTFAGAWIDHEAGGAISLAFTRDAFPTVSRLAEGFPRPLLLKAVPARRSLRQLRAIQDRIAASRLRRPYELGIDQRRNVVTMTVRRRTPSLVSRIAARYGDAVVVRRGPLSGANVCTAAECEYTLRGGLNIGCSTAFAVRRNSNGARDILSAGHCGGTNRYHSGLLYGTVQDRQVSGSVDAERHNVGYGFASRGWIFMASNNRTWAVTSRGTYAGLSIGATVCKSGRTTAVTCGTVSDKDARPGYVPNSSRFIKASGMCVKDGDSGGAVFIEHKAVGVVSGGEDDQNCNDGDEYGLFGHIEFAENAMNATVITSEGAPSFSSVQYWDSYTIIVRFSLPVMCTSVAKEDFEVLYRGVPTLLRGHDCTGDSDGTFRLRTLTPMPLTGGVSVRNVGTILDPANNRVPTVTRTG
ncbi:MAG TPA: S1 family peptidase [Solirubrobacteraceae bacterium]|nr:S1 family peptidase [Solirubrobacteraceae bacterium]